MLPQKWEVFLLSRSSSVWYVVLCQSGVNLTCVVSRAVRISPAMGNLRKGTSGLPFLGNKDESP